MHRLLERQLRRHLGRIEGFDERLSAFLAAVDEAYHAFDRDRALMERSIELTSDELCQRYEQVQEELRRRERVERELARAREAAERASLAKSRFLASMSHEIRTPLHSVLATLDLVLDGPLDDESRRLLEDGRRAGEVLLELVSGVLDLARIESGRLELDRRPFSLRDALEAVGRGIGPVAFDKGIELVVRVDPEIRDGRVGDALRLKQVLINLVGNAVKFTDRGSVCLEVDPDGADRIAFAVRDTGIGIPRDRLDGIFEAFEQARLSDAGRGSGSGLGLAITNHLVRLMGGSLAVESTEGVGSVFGFSAVLPDGGSREDRHARLTGALGGMRVDVRARGPQPERALREMLSGLGAVVTREGADAVVVDEALGAGSVAGLPEGVPIVLLRGAAAESAVEAGKRRCVVAAKPILDRGLAETLTRLVRPHPTPRPSASARRGEREPVRARVLLVDDNEVNRRLGSAMLRRLGATVVEADSGEAAVERFQEERFDLVLMDVHLPGIDGLEATRRLRRIERDRRSRPTRVVALTAQAFAEERAKCLAAGMDGFLSKPFRREDLSKVVADPSTV